MRAAKGVALSPCDPWLPYWLGILNAQHERLTGAPLHVVRVVAPLGAGHCGVDRHGDACAFAFDFDAAPLEKAGVLAETLLAWTDDYGADLEILDDACDAEGYTPEPAPLPAWTGRRIHVGLRTPTV